MSTDWSFRKLSRVSAPGGIMASGFSTLHDADIEDSSTDENEFHYEEDDTEELINETDV